MDTSHSADPGNCLGVKMAGIGPDAQEGGIDGLSSQSPAALRSEAVLCVVSFRRVRFPLFSLSLEFFLELFYVSFLAELFLLTSLNKRFLVLGGWLRGAGLTCLVAYSLQLVTCDLNLGNEIPDLACFPVT